MKPSSYPAFHFVNSRFIVILLRSTTMTATALAMHPVLRKAIFVLPLLLSIFPALSKSGGADEYYQLTIEVNEKKYSYFSTDLLNRPDIETITITDVSAYPRKKMTFKALKFASLIQDISINHESRIEFIARDGFTANLPPLILLNTDKAKSIGYLAIEDPQDPWPLYAQHMTPDEPTNETAGPFYLFWVNPELSNIGREEWPFKFNRVVVSTSLSNLYPGIVPEATGPDADRINAGFQVYVKNCLACHQINQVGPGTMGPDLNYPMNPLEYFKQGILEKFIRDPQSVRFNPRTVMGAFPESIISESELEQLIDYLGYMANHKKRK